MAAQSELESMLPEGTTPADVQQATHAEALSKRKICCIAVASAAGVALVVAAATGVLPLSRNAWPAHNLKGSVSLADALIARTGGSSSSDSSSTTAAPRCVVGEPPLVGSSMSIWCSSPDFYIEDSIQKFWDASRGNFSWNAPMQKRGGAETGVGYWLSPPKYSVDDSTGEWTSRAFVGKRVQIANRTSCCCQYMAGNGKHIWSTEYCLAVEHGLSNVWEACTAHGIGGCPADNATAASTQKKWALPAYTEVYNACLKRLSHSHGTIGQILIKNGITI